MSGLDGKGTSMPHGVNAQGVGYNLNDVSLFTAVVNASAVVDVASLADGAGATSSGITVTGAALGDFVLISCSLDLQGMTLTAYVSAANTVKFRMQNESGGTIDLASATFKVKVLR